ncbi:MAG: hypothetical protein KDE51_03185, partial [Anaerolineales bacterium]|nr:hypothetical protein [Anaerolineales bacterium]
GASAGFFLLGYRRLSHPFGSYGLEQIRQSHGVSPHTPTLAGSLSPPPLPARPPAHAPGRLLVALVSAAAARQKNDVQLSRARHLHLGREPNSNVTRFVWLMQWECASKMV